MDHEVVRLLEGIDQLLRQYLRDPKDPKVAKELTRLCDVVKRCLSYTQRHVPVATPIPEPEGPPTIWLFVSRLYSRPMLLMSMFLIGILVWLLMGVAHAGLPVLLAVLCVSCGYFGWQLKGLTV